jgi:RNA polymerase sigma factor (TIGR02999 family)
MSNVTQILAALEQGDPHAAEQLLPLVYDELRRLAAARLIQERSGQTLDATALVHEAYLRLVGDQHFDNRRHFLAAAAQAMRRILVERARRKKRLKRGGGRVRIDLDKIDVADDAADLLELDEALAQLAEVDTAAAQLVQLRYFGGLSMPQAADVLGISLRSAERLWTYARAWLRAALGAE